MKLLIPIVFAFQTANIFAQAPHSSLQVPKQIQYQGRVLQNGQPFDGNGHFAFGIYEGSTLLWTNKLPVPSPLNDPGATIDSSDSKSLTVRNGVFTVRLGEGDANNATVGTDVFFKFDGTQRVRTDVKLAVWFSPAAEGPYTRLDPDITFASVPFAQVAGVAETVKERAVTADMLADQAITSIKVAPNAITNSSIGNGMISGNKLADGTIPATKIDGNFTQSLVPSGTILPFGGTTPPAGYLMCAGQSYAKTTYPALAEALNNAFGGDTTTFRVPDLRGRFLRGTDDPDGLGSAFAAAGRDPNVSAADRPAMNSGGASGNNVGSVQGDAFQEHRHLTVIETYQNNGPLVSPNAAIVNRAVLRQYTDRADYYLGGNTQEPNVGRTSSAGNSVETRPKNANVNYIIKF